VAGDRIGGLPNVIDRDGHELAAFPADRSGKSFYGDWYSAGM
jgi:hypothetical protein